MIVHVHDVQETDGRKLAEMIGGPVTVFKRVLIACALELGSGRMVWCSSRADRLKDYYLDLNAPDQARQVVGEVLADF